jgi:hypothetical protein
MATLTIGLSGSGVVNGSKNYTISDAHILRLIDAMKYYNGDGTNAQLLVAWADSLIAHTKSMVVKKEQNTAIFLPPDIT